MTEIFSIDEDFGGTVIASRLHEDINSTLNTECTGVSVNIPEDGQVQIEFAQELSTNEKTTLATLVVEHVQILLDEEKKKHYRDIDREIERRIRAGFEYPGASNRRFSLSVNAQLKWAGLVVSKDMIPYPLRVPTIDDSDYHDIQDATEVANMWQYAVGTVKQHISDGTNAKENIKMATTHSEINTIKDQYFGK